MKVPQSPSAPHVFCEGCQHTMTLHFVNISGTLFSKKFRAVNNSDHQRFLFRFFLPAARRKKRGARSRSPRRANDLASFFCAPCSVSFALCYANNSMIGCPLSATVNGRLLGE